MQSHTALAARLTDEEIMQGHAKALFNLVSHEDKIRIQFLLDAGLNENALTVADEVLDKVRSKFQPETQGVFVLSVPIVLFSSFVHRNFGFHPVMTKYSVAWSVVFAGAYLATNPVHWVPHFIWDGIAYTIHGFGAAPIAEAMIRRISKK